MIDKRLFAETNAARLMLRLTVLFGLLTGATVIVQAFLLSRVIDRAFLGESALDAVAVWLLLLAAAVAVRALLAWGGRTASRRLAVQVKTDLRARLMAHLFALGPAYTGAERSGELVNTATEGVESLEDYFADFIPAMYNALLVPLLILIVVLPVDLLTFVVLVVTGPLIPVFMALIGMIAGRVARQQYDSMSRMSAHFLDVMQGLTTLKLFNRAGRQTATIAAVSDDFRKATMKVLRVAFLSSFWLELLATISVAVVAVEIGLRLLYGGIAFEAALFLLVVAPDYYLPLRALGQKFHAGTEGKAASERIFAILETPVSVPEPAQPAAAPRAPFDLRLDGVTFAYGPERPALNDVSLTLHAGERLALVGPSGAGKSTVARLLLRFIAPDSGRVLAGDTDLADLRAADWRRLVAWVPQTPYLFNRSVADNIRLGQPGADDVQVIEAARQAEAHGFIEALPDGYNTVIGERGARLSGGQAQRIAVARALLKDAPVLVMDEATSNLDPETEAALEAALERLMQGRTVLMIAHRLSTVYRAHRIVVMQAGRIAQVGTHSTLMAEGGLYRELVTAYGQLDAAEEITGD